MTNKSEVYKCEICGNVVEVLHEAAPDISCCGQPMKLQVEQNEEEGKTEKHKPVIEGNTVRVGSVPHPMTNEHSIEWIEATDGKEIAKLFLSAGQEPSAEFSFEPISARAYCNIHGLWKSN
jgi:superoxide reductase